MKTKITQRGKDAKVGNNSSAPLRLRAFALRTRRGLESGLTLVEMMVATTLLVVMMLGLTAMFNQTQRAFRGGLKQVDVFEGGRAIMDLISRDVEQAVMSKSLNDSSLYMTIPPGSTYLIQKTPVGTSDLRTNLLSELFFYNYSTSWSALGYRVLDPNNVDATNLTYGTLYRFSTNFSYFNPAIRDEHLRTFTNNSPSVLTNQSMTRVADGVVHFRVQFYDAAGKLIPLPEPNGNIFYDGTTGLATNVPSAEVRADVFPAGLGLPNEPRVIFDNALPAMIEIELGIIEPQTLEQARSVMNPKTFLAGRASKVHIFRQQIVIRNAQLRNAQR
jgi:hypothetical protein